MNASDPNRSDNSRQRFCDNYRAHSPIYEAERNSLSSLSGTRPEPPLWVRQKGVTPICSDFFRFLPICAPCFREIPDVFRFAPFSSFVPICFQNKSEQIRETPFCRPLFRRDVKWGMGWVMVGTAVFGAPRFFAKTLENTAFFHKKMQKSGRPKNGRSNHHPSHPPLDVLLHLQFPELGGGQKAH